MTVGELKKALEKVDDENEVRIHTQIKNEHYGHCLSVIDYEEDNWEFALNTSHIIKVGDK